MRKLFFSVILILLVLGCYQVLFGNKESVRKNVASISEIKSSSQNLKDNNNKLKDIATEGFEEKKHQLSRVIEEYESTKFVYDDLVSQLSTETSEDLIQTVENDLKDIYDVDFLWTIVGNYATEEGINLKFDVSRNLTSASSITNNSTNYVVCDLKFVITGKYINLTDFIYDLEDDDRLNFEINDFEMTKSGESDLQVTLNVKEIKINSDNLIESGVSSVGSTITNTIENFQNENTNTTNTMTNNTTNSTVNNSITN